jgi:hypothetical protein
MATIKTDDLSASLRARSIRPETREILISRIDGSPQEPDLSEPPNCQGYGRIRHFRMDTPTPWPSNPLPMLPASHRLGTSPHQVSNAQVFQNASCNWRCWYCFVPFNLLGANEANSVWLTSEQLVELYLAEDNRTLVIDCSGGQPDLIPEWVPWMMEALTTHDLADKVYLWSDDNLSNDYFWRYLSPDQRQTMKSYRMYGRVCCLVFRISPGYYPTTLVELWRAEVSRRGLTHTAASHPDRNRRAQLPICHPGDYEWRSRPKPRRRC